MHKYFADDIDDKAAKEKEKINTSYLLFTVCGETFGIQINNVRVIIQKPNLCSIPDMPPYISGLTNYIKKVYPVMDMRKRFHMLGGNNSDRIPVILIQSGTLDIGIIVDDITDVTMIDADKILAVPSERTGFFNKFVKGFAEKEDCLIYIVDCDALFINEKEYIEEINNQDPDVLNGGNLNEEENE